MKDDWKARGVWVEARISRVVVSGAGPTQRWQLHAWVHWKDGTFGTFEASFASDPGPRYRPGNLVTVLVDPQARLRRFQVTLDPPPDARVDRDYARPAEEPALVGSLVGAPPAPMGAPRTGPPRPAKPNELPLWLACVLVVIMPWFGSKLWVRGDVVSGLFFAAFVIFPLPLLVLTVRRELGRAQLRCVGVRTPATVTDVHQRVFRDRREGLLAWEVIATATGPAGHAVTLTSGPLRDDPTPWCPPGTGVTALIHPRDPSSYRLLLHEVRPDRRSGAA